MSGPAEEAQLSVTASNWKQQDPTESNMCLTVADCFQYVVDGCRLLRMYACMCAHAYVSVYSYVPVSVSVRVSASVSGSVSVSV